jgi:hypothetical protein
MDRGATYIGISPSSVSSGGAPFSSIMRAEEFLVFRRQMVLLPLLQAIRSFAADPRDGPFQAMDKGIILSDPLPLSKIDIEVVPD